MALEIDIRRGELTVGTPGVRIEGHSGGPVSRRGQIQKRRHAQKSLIAHQRPKKGAVEASNLVLFDTLTALRKQSSHAPHAIGNRCGLRIDFANGKIAPIRETDSQDSAIPRSARLVVLLVIDIQTNDDVLHPATLLVAHSFTTGPILSIG